jgi:hypothetical protein
VQHTAELCNPCLQGWVFTASRDNLCRPCLILEEVLPRTVLVMLGCMEKICNIMKVDPSYAIIKLG